ncbi:MAG TPA: type I restriction-modification system subunit M [Mucilaginibacter sp.]|nr:type I restriction-modification system subunit M [Mucilaginibacter sp.]
MNKQQLAAKIWESANQMRSKIEANEYKDYILGFIFYKYLSEYEIKFAKKERFTDEDIKRLSEEDTETANYIKKNIGYFIAYKDLFSNWIEKGSDFEVSNVRDALSAFSRLINPAHKKLFNGVFDTLQTGLSKLGETAALQTKAISELIQLIKAIPMDGRQDYDVLGFIYEYLIEKFAANAGKKAGEFYTPHEVSVLMSEIIAHHLKDRSEIQIYDPTSGSGSLLINIGKSVAKHLDGQNKIKYYAQELKQNTYNLTRMNLIMRGISIGNIETRNGDTLEQDWPYFDENDPLNSYKPLYLDAVVSNPPYSQKWDPTDKESDPRYARFGVAPKSKADFAFLLHDLYHLKPDGIMTIVLPHGVLFRGGEEGAIRKKLVEQNHIDAIIGLPANIFFGTGIPTIVMVLRQKRAETDVLIVDASKGFIKEGKNNKLRASDIKRITDAVTERQTIPKYATLVSRKDLRDNEYNLNISRYVDSGEAAESWDIYATMFGGIPIKEIDELSLYWDAFPGLKESLFTSTSGEMAALKMEDVTTGIETHAAVKAFVESFTHAFADFDATLKKRLIDGMMNLSIAKEKSMLSDNIFARLQSIALVDKYEAYQLLDDDWQGISTDLEMLQTEGFEAAKQVDANLVTKKVKGKDTEVQDGWKGHILPFELVQQVHLADELKSLLDKENRLAEINAEYEELLDGLSEEAKDSDITNEAKDAFVSAEIVKAAKEIAADIKKGKYTEEDDETKIWRVNLLIAEEKTLKKEISEEAYALHLLTKQTIETLTDEQVNELLERKWISPLVDALHGLPGNNIAALIQKVNYLAGKYCTTLQEVSNQLQDTEQALAKMMGELTGSEHDRQGLNEWQKLLKGVNNGN